MKRAAPSRRGCGPSQALPGTLDRLPAGDVRCLGAALTPILPPAREAPRPFVGRMGPLDEFRRRMDDFTEMVKSRALRPGFTEVLIPGEQEARRVARKSVVGIPLENAVLDDLRTLGVELGVGAQITVIGPWEDDTL